MTRPPPNSNSAPHSAPHSALQAAQQAAPSDILTVTLNPALDISANTPQVAPGPKLRTTRPVYEPGGGGINVSRAIAHLGGTSTAFIALGGATGAQMAELMDKAQIATLPFAISGQTRQSLAVTETRSGDQYRYVTPGPDWSAQQLRDALRAIAADRHEGCLVVLSGSQPPGVPADFPAQLAQKLQSKNARLIVDTSGAPLKALAARPARPFVVRMDDVEAAEITEDPLRSPEDTARFAERLVAGGVAEIVIIARGADGSVMADAQGAVHARLPIPAARVRSAVGAGDSFVGGFALSLARGQSRHDALAYGTAAASAACLTEGSALCSLEDVTSLLPEVTLQNL